MTATSAMTGRRLVVVGGSLAGVRAVEGARAAGWSGPITVLSAEPHQPYDRPPLSKELLAVGGPSEAVPLRSAETLAELDIDLRLSTPALGLDPERRVVRVPGEEIAYDALVIATGSRPRSLPGSRAVEGAAAGVHQLRGLDDARALREALDAGGPVVVIGAGFIGSEVASAARARGLPVTLVEAAPRPLARAMSETAAEHLVAIHHHAGVDVLLGATVAEIRVDGGRVAAVVLDDGRELPAAVVVLGLGATPETAWLAGSGIELDAVGGVVVDPAMATSLAHVWAAGDCASLAGHPGQHWTAAAEQGRLAGANAAGGD
ncbi:MAG: NAD(P)/FAD-dependent oxidoreductase, partial [Nocardioides sp.]|uniref:NAD(P)/FAD-dependent oxidoreductase n=1 Tax=Nocardioides sp. TaxID=35761 RepID=UPI0039E69260